VFGGLRDRSASRPFDLSQSWYCPVFSGFRHKGFYAHVTSNNEVADLAKGVARTSAPSTEEQVCEIVYSNGIREEAHHTSPQSGVYQIRQSFKARSSSN